MYEFIGQNIGWIILGIVVIFFIWVIWYGDGGSGDGGGAIGGCM